jgi:hypothetical protein
MSLKRTSGGDFASRAHDGATTPVLTASSGDRAREDFSHESKIRIVSRVVSQLERGNRSGVCGVDSGSSGEEVTEEGEDPLLDDAALTELGDGDLEEVNRPVVRCFYTSTCILERHPKAVS